MDTATQDYQVKVNGLELINYKKFTKSKIILDASLTVLSGKNGAGKSSVLSSVKIILSWIIARLRNENGAGLYIPPLYVNNRSIDACVNGEIFGGSVSIPSKAKSGFTKRFNFNIAPLREYVSYKRGQLSENPTTTCLPVFAYYGVERAVIDIPLRTRSQNYSIFDAYEKCLEGAANFRSFFTWFRACEDWENQETVRTGKRVMHPGLKAFRTAMERFMPDYRNIYVERHPLGMILKKNGYRLYAEQLSDGEKIYLALIGDLCHRLSLANPIGNPLDGEGIVLIDEIDLHLHPQWQSEIATVLTQTFPNIQFVVSTHSPHVINSVPTTSLRLIGTDGSIEPATYGYGMPSEIILGDLMRLSNDVPIEIATILDNFNSAVGDNNPQEAQRLLTDLQSKVPNHPELARMRKRVERMMR